MVFIPNGCKSSPALLYKGGSLPPFKNTVIKLSNYQESNSFSHWQIVAKKQLKLFYSYILVFLT